MAKPDCSLQELVHLYTAERLTLKAIGEKFGISKQAVHSRLRRAGIEMRPPIRTTSKIDRKELYCLYVNQKMSVAEIG